jgi:uncharacterized protein YyaL (SSP411 family)
MLINSKKALTGTFAALLILTCFTSDVFSDPRYTREKAEELFHLIHWHEYTSETFQKALKEQKPIFLVLSAPAWCYWCHVYESTDYLYHPDLYPFINENFIAVFIDSDKRPDLTKKYIEGGWPSTTIFTPDFSRINGFSGPVDPPALKDYLVRVIDYLKDKSFTEQDREISYRKVEPRIPDESHLKMLESGFLEHLESTFDDSYGGFLQGGREQKFPAGMAYKYLLEKYEETGRANYLNMVQKTFDNQYTEITELEEGYHLYDPVEGGFHRYSTKRDWSIPHYEKMLGDEAKILRAYTHLLKITNDARVRNAVEGTISFVLEKFYDERGGFYSSQDAYLEDKYYGLNKDERKKIAPPYIDKTRIIDANAKMTGTFLYLYESLSNKDYMAVAQKSLDFLKENMVGSNGAYYYFDYDKNEPLLTGQTISNAWALLVFIDGYSVLGDRVYLSTAEHIAEYSLNNLYDWNSGGFFERNSKDNKYYAPDEQLDLSKPYQENAVFTFAMLRLHLLKGDLKYLEAGLKTLGHLLSNRPGGIDDIYYAVKAAKLAGDNDLLNVYKNNRKKLDSILEHGKSDFFLSKHFAEKREPETLQDPPELTGIFTGEGFMVLSILAFLAGILSFLSPCTLPILPAYFAQGFHAGKGEILKNTVFFFLGLATIFSLFGMGATLIGNIMREHRQVFTQAAAVVIIVFGILEIFGKGFSGLNVYLKGSHRTPVGSYLFGSVFAVGWSACIGPILASFLLLSAASGTVLKGTSLLFIYAAGLAVPLMLVSLYFDRVRSNKFWKILQGRELNWSVFNKQVSFHTTHLISGLILIALGVLIFNDYLFKLNQLTFQTDYVQDIIVKGEEFLKGLFTQ